MKRRLTLVVLLSPMVACQTFTNVMKFAAGTKDVDSRPALGWIARSISETQPEPLWQIPLGTADADFFEPLGEDGLLLGELKTSNTGMYSLGPVTAFDRSTGEPRWTIDRSGSYRKKWTVVQDEPTLVIDERDGDKRRLLAYSVDDGAPIWKESMGTNAAVLRSSDRSLIVVDRKARRLDANDGSTLWERPVATTDDGPVPFLVDELLICPGEKLDVLEIATGDLVWDRPLASPSAARFTPTADGLVVHDGDRRLSLHSLESGEVRWSVDDVGSMLTIAARGDRVLSCVRRTSPERITDGRTLIRCRDAATGELDWERSERLSVQSGFEVANGLLAFTSYQTVELWDIDTGEPRASIEIDGQWDLTWFASADSAGTDTETLENRRAYAPTGVYGQQLPCNLSLSSDRLTVSSEEGVLLVDLATPEAYDRFVLPDVETVGKLASEMARESVDKEAYERASFDHLAASQSVSLQMANHHAWMTNQWDRRVEATRNDAGRRSGDHVMALQGAMNSLQLQHASERLAANMQFQSALAAAGEAIRKGIERAYKEASFVRHAKRLELAHVFHGRSLQEPYWVHPFESSDPTVGRVGVLIVDRRDGRWAELTLGPVEGISGAFVVGTPHVWIDDEAKRLYAHGTGLDAGQWGAYEWGWPNVRIYPTASILAFDLDELEWRANGEFVDRELVLVGEGVVEPLREAVALAENRGVATRSEFEALLGPSMFESHRLDIGRWIYGVEREGEIESVKLFATFDAKGVLNGRLWTAWGSKEWMESWPD